MASFSTYSFKDYLMDVSYVPGSGLGAREWKEQGLCSHGSYHTEGVRWEKA